MRKTISFKQKFLSALVTLVCVFNYLSPLAHASISSCSFSLSPNSVAPGSDTYAVFSVTNTSSTPIQYVQFTSSGSQIFSVQSASAYQWSIWGSTTTANFSGSTLNPGQSFNFTVEFVASGTPTSSPASWTTQASDDPNGLNPTVCSGDGSVSIVAQPSSIAITNVGVTAVAPTEATISWTTDVPSTSLIRFGLDTNYGSATPVDNNLVTDHSVIVKNLDPATTYHYQVTSTTTDGGTQSQGDNTLLTAVKPPPAPIQSSPILSNPTLTPSSPLVAPEPVKIGIIPIVPTLSDQNPPTISIDSHLAAVVKSLPTISGVADDDTMLARIEYSTDGGKGWLPADTINGLGTKHINFSFTPGNTLDGNYVIVTRATDAAGNTALSSPQTVVVDRLPPIFSNMVITFGPQTLQTNPDSSVLLASGSTYKITGQAVGGATLINIIARNSLGKAQTYSLAQDAQSGLWSGAMSLTANGKYRLSVKAVDGAQNHTERQLGEVSVASAGKVIDTSGKPISDAKVTLFYLEPTTKHWTVWDGKPYEQVNPQYVHSGDYRMMVPAGQYYLRVDSNGYGSAITDKFTLSSAQSLSQVFTLHNHALIRFGRHALSIPSWPQVVKVTNGISAGNKYKDSLVGSPLPAFNLPKLGGGMLQKLDLYGRPTDLVLLDTWSPNGVDQLSALAAVQKNSDVGVVPVFEGQGAQSAHGYVQQAGIALTGIADPDNSLSESLRAGMGPRHVLIDRSGRIKKVMVGVLSEDKILQELGGI